MVMAMSGGYATVLAPWAKVGHLIEEGRLLQAVPFALAQGRAGAR